MKDFELKTVAPLAAVVILAVMAGVLLVSWGNERKIEAVNRAHEVTKRQIRELFEDQLNNVPNRLMMRRYEKLRLWFAEEMRSAYGIEVLSQWEREMYKQETNRVSFLAPLSVQKWTSQKGFRDDPFRRGTGGQEGVMHDGVDLGAVVGTPVLCPADGVVARIRNRNGAYGRTLYVDHGGGVVSMFAHLKSVEVRKDQVVSRGQVVARTGNTGRSTGPHLHWTVTSNGRVVDPVAFLK